jgi:KDO2-lipid IV(A) lauroyltransferase
LRLALPELDATARRQVIRGVWDNLGRTIGELPHIAALQRTTYGPGWEVEGEAIALRMATILGR